jgi:hypothetical protein
MNNPANALTGSVAAGGLLFPPLGSRDRARLILLRLLGVLTVNVYTDVPAPALHEEIAKYPWLDN